MNDQPLLRLEHVAKRFDAVEGAPPVEVLGDVSLTMQRGDSLAIVGPSGCGKSTLLNIIGALDRPTGGRVLLEGDDLAALDDKAAAAVRNRRLGFVFQDHHLLPQCTVIENVLVPTLVAPPEEGVSDRARALLQRVGLGDHLHHRPGQLSGGQRQRVAVVRALINRPALLLADEPTGSLDRASSDNLADLLVELNQQDGVSLIIVTHAMTLARRMARIATLTDGSLESTS
jgi:ABC-type lipoprotein export system ATPase subunit